MYIVMKLPVVMEDEGSYHYQGTYATKELALQAIKDLVDNSKVTAHIVLNSAPPAVRHGAEAASANKRLTNRDGNSIGLRILVPKKERH